MLVAVGLLAMVTNLADAEVDLGQYFGVAIGVLGLGLLIGTWWGHARALILLGILLLPFAFAASLVACRSRGAGALTASARRPTRSSAASIAWSAGRSTST